MSVTTTLARVTDTAWLRPAVVGVAALGVCVAVNVRDPNVAGNLGLCPFLAVTGWQCPGCGTLRATRALTRGDVLLAADLNVLTTLLLPVLIVAWGSWMLSATGRRRQATWQLPSWAGTTLALAVPAFWILRNTPMFAVLAP